MKLSALAATGLVVTLGLAPALLAAAEKKDEPKKTVVTESKTTEMKEEKRETVKTATLSADQEKLRREAKISMETARAVAQKRVAGKIQSEELEREHGKLIYSFDIRKAPNSIEEVNVDAINGRIVGVSHESAAKEAAEKKQEATKVTGTTSVHTIKQH